MYTAMKTPKVAIPQPGSHNWCQSGQRCFQKTNRMNSRITNPQSSARFLVKISHACLRRTFEFSQIFLKTNGGLRPSFQ